MTAVLRPLTATGHRIIANPLPPTMTLPREHFLISDPNLRSRSPAEHTGSSKAAPYVPWETANE